MLDSVLGKVTVPDGNKGPWRIDTITLSESDVLLDNLRAIRDGVPWLVCKAGTYRRLICKGRGVIMSNTPMEIYTNLTAFQQGTGRVLINGLGMGMLVEALLTKPDVTLVRVIEKEQDVIDLVAPHFAHDPRFEVVHADAFEYKPAKGEVFDFVWHDIWDNISPENLPEMATLSRRYGRRAKAQGVWSQHAARRMRRQAQREGW